MCSFSTVQSSIELVFISLYFNCPLVIIYVQRVICNTINSQVACSIALAQEMTTLSSDRSSPLLSSPHDQASPLQYCDGYYGHMFLWMAHQPRSQQKASRIIISMNAMIIIAAIISLGLMSQMSEMAHIFAGYICMLIIRSILVVLIHIHCLYVPEMCINRHSIRDPATIMHKVQRAVRIAIRIESVIVLTAVLIWLFVQLDVMDPTFRSLALVWVGIDIVVVLGEVAIYCIVIQVVSWRVVSLIAPYLPISKQSLVMFQCEQEQAHEQAQKRAGLDQKQLKELKNSQHRYKPDENTINTDCAICLLDFEINEKINTLSCHHSYHSSCIILWLRQRGTCPLCSTRASPLITSTTKSSPHSPFSLSPSSEDDKLSIVTI